MGRHSLAVQILQETSAMRDQLMVKNVERGLGVTHDMSHHALEDLRFVSRVRPDIGIAVLKFYLLPSKVVWEPAKCAAFVLVAILVREGVTFNALTHFGGLLL
jgi:hypothetical protein